MAVHSYGSLGSHKVAAHKSSAGVMLLLMLPFFSLNTFVLLREFNVEDKSYIQRGLFLVRSAEWKCSTIDTDRELWNFCAAFSVPFPHLFFLLGSLKWCCYSRCAIWRTDKRNTSLKYENMSACGHHYGCPDHLRSPEITSRPVKEKKKSVCVSMHEGSTCMPTAICTELTCPDFKHMSSCF